MTLVRQLVLIVSLTFAMVFVGTFVVTADNTRRFLVTQLESHAQDTATALGLSLSPPMASRDVLTMQSMVDAVFDRGYYREIVVVAQDRTPLVDRVNVVKVHGVPAWFIRWLPLPTPKASAHVMAGWQRGGTVHVASHPGYAYHELWANTMDTLRWSLGTLGFAVLLTVGALRILLRPLIAVEQQAAAISHSDFRKVEAIPRTRELRRVVLAMNSMSGKLEEVLTGLFSRIRQLRDQAYTDTLTGLGNARAFERDLHELVSRPEEHAFGACLLINLAGVEVANEVCGYGGGDELIRVSGQRLEALQGERRGLTARLGGGMFALVLPDLDLEDGKAIAAEISSTLSSVSVGGLEPAGASVGLAFFQGRQSDAQMRSALEGAVREAQEAGPNRWHLFEDPEPRAGEGDLAETFEARLVEVIERGEVVLYFQPVVTADLVSTLHHEVLARVPLARGDHELVPAGAFLAAVKRAGLALDFDRLVVRAGLEHLRRCADASIRLAINLSPAACRDETFATWLVEELRAAGHLAEQLSFEVSAYAAAEVPENLLILARRLHEVGAEVGLDHFGVGDLSLEYIRSLRIDYAKLDGAFIREIEANPNHRAFVEGCLDVGRGTDIRVIAERVETDAELAVLREIGIDGVQGYRIGRPAVWGDQA